MSSSTGVFSLFCRLGVVYVAISIFQTQVRDLAKHIEAQPKKHNAYKKKRVIAHRFTYSERKIW